MKNGTLYAHCGGYAASLDQVADVATPAATGTHYPIPHIMLVEQLQSQIIAAGYEIEEQAFALQTAKDVTNANLFGLLQLRHTSSDYALAVGVRNSHAMMFSASLALGSRVFVCDNLALSGEIKIGRKHTLNIMRDLPSVVGVAVGRLSDERTRQDERFLAYQSTEIDQITYDHALLDLVRTRAVSASDIGKVVKQIENPTHKAHLNEAGNATVWTVYNAITETIRGQSIFALPRRMTIAHGRLDGLCGIGRANVVEQFAAANIEDAEFEEMAA